jgi:hypothetical protein
VNAFADHVEQVLQTFLEAIFQYSQLEFAREQERRRQLDMALRAERAASRQAKSKQVPKIGRTRSAQENVQSQLLLVERHFINQGEREEKEIMRLQSEILSSERSLELQQQKLDDLVARKLRIVAESLRLKNARRKGRETIKWIKDQPFSADQHPDDDDDVTFTERLGAAAFLSKKGSARSSRRGSSFEELLEIEVKKMSAQVSLAACVLVYCAPLSIDSRERLLDRVWASATSLGLVQKPLASTRDTFHRLNCSSSAAQDSAMKEALVDTPRPQTHLTFINELVCRNWKAVVIDPAMLVPCQILTFCSSTPLLLDEHGIGIEWLRRISSSWVSSTCPGATGRPQSELLPPDSDAIWQHGTWEASMLNSPTKVGGCEATIKNLPAALRKIQFAAEEGLVAIIHDVDSLEALNQIPMHLLAPVGGRRILPKLKGQESAAESQGIRGT